MTKDYDPLHPRVLALRGLPWLVALAAFGVYLFTLNHWISLLNLSQVGEVTGQNYQPVYQNPAYYLATFPLRFLPEAYAPIALNLLSALFGALTLAQLARTVALLPRDRTHDLRDREPSDAAVLSNQWSWLPPVLAVIACGLQLTFWEHATNGSSEMLDILIFGFVGRCLMEFRAGGAEKWLVRSALAYGIGITSNFAMLAFFPLYLVALVWLKGISFFNTRFLGRMTLFGCVGLSLYLLLPLISPFTSSETITFWQVLRGNLKAQKDVLLMFPRKDLLLLSLTSLVPVTLLSIRWQSYFGDSSLIGQWIANAVFHFVQAFFLFACLWTAMDPPSSPRNMELSGPGVLRALCQFLPLYYLGAVSIGYFAGYFLLVFGPRRYTRMRRPPTPLLDKIHPLSVSVVVLLLIATPVALWSRNSSTIARINGDSWQRFAANNTHGLPKSAILLADDPWRLLLAHSWLAKQGRANDYLTVNTSLLESPHYHDYLNKRTHGLWPASPADKKKTRIDSVTHVNLFLALSKTNQLCYLHPSFGFYFESFYAEPHGMTYHIHPYPAATLLPPPLATNVLTENESFWSDVADTALPPIIANNTAAEAASQRNLSRTVFAKLKLRRHENRTLAFLGMYYSRCINTWGVEMQKLDRFEAAGRWFDTAVKLNANNVVAAINSEYNRNLQAGERGAIQIPKSVEDRFGVYRTWDDVLGANGPYDEPSLSYAQAYAFLQATLFRQAGVAFDRVRALSDSDVISRLWLGKLNLMARLPDRALEFTSEIHAHPERFALDDTNRADLISVEVSALFAKSEKDRALQILNSAASTETNNVRLLNVVTSLYSENGYHSNALNVIHRLLQINPEDHQSRVNEGCMYVNLNQYELGIASFSKALNAITNNPSPQTIVEQDLQRVRSSALFNRAIAYLRADRLTEAREDYEQLQQQFPTVCQIYYGLAEIALRQKETNAAIRYFETYLTNAPPKAPETLSVASRLADLKGDKPKQ